MSIKIVLTKNTISDMGIEIVEALSPYPRVSLIHPLLSVRVNKTVKLDTVGAVLMVMAPLLTIQPKVTYIRTVDEPGLLVDITLTSLTQIIEEMKE